MVYLNTRSKKISKFLELSNKNKVVFIFSIIFFTIFQIIYKLLNLKKTINIIEKLKKLRTTNKSYNYSKLENTLKVIYTAQNNTIFNTTCLEKSLFLYALLSILGIESKIVIGVNKNIQEFNAHAWVEYDGQIINDQLSKISDYKILSI